MSDEPEEREPSDVHEAKWGGLLDRLIPGATVVVLTRLGMIVIIGGSDAIN